MGLIVRFYVRFDYLIAPKCPQCRAISKASRICRKCDYANVLAASRAKKGGNS